MASAFGIFLLRQTFKTVPRELDEAARVEGCGPLARAVEGLRAARAARLSRLRARQRQLPLEQFPLAAHHHEFGGVAAADRRAAGVLVRRPGHRLVDHHGGDACSPRRRCRSRSFSSEAVRPEFHARGDSVKRTSAVHRGLAALALAMLSAPSRRRREAILTGRST